MTNGGVSEAWLTQVIRAAACSSPSLAVAT